MTNPQFFDHLVQCAGVSEHAAVSAEEWRACVDQEGRYEVSNMGRVRSVDRLVERSGGAPFRLRGRVLKPSVDGSGHLSVTLGGGAFNQKVHALVCAAFIGPRPTPEHHVMHLDHDKKNNRLTNLKYGTRTENVNQDYDDATGRRARVVRVRDSAGAEKTYRSITDASIACGRHKVTMKRYANLGAVDPVTGCTYLIAPMNFEQRRLAH